jgi:hypothetical protein
VPDGIIVVVPFILVKVELLEFVEIEPDREFATGTIIPFSSAMYPGGT